MSKNQLVYIRGGRAGHAEDSSPVRSVGSSPARTSAEPFI